MRETVKVERPVSIIFHDAQNVMFRRILYCSEHFWSRARRNLYCIWNHDISQSLWLAPINLNVAQIEKIFWQWIVSSFHGHEGSLQIRSRSAQIVTTAVNFKSETNVVEPNDDSTCFDDSHELQMASTFKWQTSTSSGWWCWHLNGNITTGARRLNVNCPKIALNGTTSL